MKITRLLVGYPDLRIVVVWLLSPRLRLCGSESCFCSLHRAWGRVDNQLQLVGLILNSMVKNWKEQDVLSLRGSLEESNYLIVSILVYSRPGLSAWFRQVFEDGLCWINHKRLS